MFSVVYLLVRRLLGCLMVLARGEVSKDAELLVLRHQSKGDAAAHRRRLRLRAVRDRLRESLLFLRALMLLAGACAECGPWPA
jgi:hypothetical protein